MLYLFLKNIFFIPLVLSQSVVPPQFQNAIDLHNYYRRVHCVKNLTWNSAIARIAQNHAMDLAINGTFEHGMLQTEDNTRVGQNLAAFSSYNNEKFDAPNIATKLWYEEIKDYNWTSPGSNIDVTGHFTQVVWKESTLIGFGMYTYNRRIVVVANYYVPGNVIGRFRSQVLQRTCTAVQTPEIPKTQNVIPVVESSDKVGNSSAINVYVTTGTTYIYKTRWHLFIISIILCILSILFVAFAKFIKRRQPHLP